jgi:hypothetical protein
MALRMRRIACLDHADHPLRPDLAIVNEVLARLDRLFQQKNAAACGCRPSIDQKIGVVK